MNKYLATVRVKGQPVKTLVFADSSFHARLILEFQFGIGNVVSTPFLTTEGRVGYMPLDELIGNLKPIKPMNPQKAKLNSLKKQKEVASNNLKAERDRQKISKAQKQIWIVNTEKTVA